MNVKDPCYVSGSIHKVFFLGLGRVACVVVKLAKTKVLYPALNPKILYVKRLYLIRIHYIQSWIDENIFIAIPIPLFGDPILRNEDRSHIKIRLGGVSHYRWSP